MPKIGEVYAVCVLTSTVFGAFIGSAAGALSGNARSKKTDKVERIFVVFMDSLTGFVCGGLVGAVAGFWCPVTVPAACVSIAVISFN